MTLVVGTAGHIDHGKTTLLRALTGIDADRLPEERRRGMTIDVGYAHLTLDDGQAIDFVDVPGHDRLIGNMLVGAGEVDAILLVVAADDGPRAQTIEHLELVDALGLTDGLVAVTKTDGVEPERLADVLAAVRALLAPTHLADVPILPVSAVTGEGVPAVRAALVALLDRVHADRPTDAIGPRLALDRVFSIRGRGAVVTGTLRGGAVARGDTLAIEPGGRTVRVREVQVHGHTVERSTGGRTAVNVAGIEAGDLRRGQVLAAPGAAPASDRLLVALQPPARVRSVEPALPTDRARVRLHLGTEQVDARVGRSGREAVDLPDGRVTAVLRLERPIAVAAGDRFVLRRPSPGLTVAGGVVLDLAPPRGVSRRRVTPERVVALAAAIAAGPASTERLDLHGGLVSGAGLDLSPDVRADLASTGMQEVERRHAERPQEPGIALPDLRTELARRLRRLVTADGPLAIETAKGVIGELLADGRLERSGDRIHRPGHRPTGPPAAVLEAMTRLVAALDVPAPPPLGEAVRAARCANDAVRALERDGRIVRLGADLAWATPAWERLARLALELAERAPLVPAALRDASGTSRKYVMPLLEDLDRRGILARTPAGHVPGPRAALVARQPVGSSPVG